MGLVFVILFHKNEAQLFRLIDQLNEGNVSFVVHVCKNYTQIDSLKKRIEGISNVTLCDRARGTWASYGITKATFYGIEEALRLRSDFSHMILLRAQDYPLRSNQEIQNFFSDNIGYSFIAHELLNPELNAKGEYFHPIKNHWTSRDESGRYKFYNLKIWKNRYWRLHTEKGEGRAYRVKLRNFLKLILKSIIPPRKFYSELTPYFGPQWIVLSNEQCRHVVEAFPLSSAYHHYMKSVFCPDEVFFQTILLNSKYRDKIKNQCLHHIRWSCCGHPDIFKKRDFRELIGSSEDALFARKFDSEVDTDVLDLIDQELLSA